MMETGLDDGTTWRALKRALTADLIVSQSSLTGWEPGTTSLGGFDLRVSVLNAGTAVPVDIAHSSHVLILEVRRDQPLSMDRFAALVKEFGPGHVIAAVPNLTVDDARSLLRAGAGDVLSLPLQQSEVEAILARIRTEIESRPGESVPAGQVVSVVRSVGGVGATALVTQLACLRAQTDGGANQTCLLDLDLQFGSAALYLGTLPKMGIKDLIDAGSRVDGAMLRSAAATHSSGLHYIAAPQDLLPLDALDQDHAAALLGLAAREYEMVFVDLPASWTNWSLSVLARSDLILLVCELSVASLHQARRQLDLIGDQGLGDIPVQIIMNKVEKKLFKAINLKDAERALGRAIDHVVTADPDTVTAALDQGVPFSAISGRSRVSRDLQAMLDGVGLTLAEVG